MYHLNGRPIDKVDNICDIGVYIQSNLKFTTHCNQLAKKAHFSIRNIFNTFKGHDMEFYVPLYQTYVRPILEYASPAWSPRLKGNIDRLESVQRYFTRRLFSACYKPYMERLSGLQLDSLEIRRIKAGLMLLYKCINDLADIDSSNSMRFSHSFRGHNLNWYRFYSQTGVRKCFWLNRLVTFWNNLDGIVVNAPTISVFKRLIRSVSMIGRESIYC